MAQSQNQHFRKDQRETEIGTMMIHVMALAQVPHLCLPLDLAVMGPNKFLLLFKSP